jgi:hypothetical protein
VRAGGSDRLGSPEHASPARSGTTAQYSELGALYEEELARRSELGFAELKAEIGLRRAASAKISFGPTKAKHFDLVASQLGLTAAERSVFQQRGFVSVDHGQHYSMASLYYAVYARDLPVLVTSDSVLGEPSVK